VDAFEGVFIDGPSKRFGKRVLGRICKLWFFDFGQAKVGNERIGENWRGSWVEDEGRVGFEGAGL
jgi:hypothetical protein